jgi:hypothetical protein
MKHWILYHPQSGQIVGSMRGDACGAGEHEMHLHDGSEYSADDHFIHEGVIKERPTMPLHVGQLLLKSDGVDEVKITGVPFGATCSVDGQSSRVTDGTIEFSTSTPGTYNFHIQKFPFKEVYLSVKAVEQ